MRLCYIALCFSGSQSWSKDDPIALRWAELLNNIAIKLEATLATISGGNIDKDLKGLAQECLKYMKEKKPVILDEDGQEEWPSKLVEVLQDLIPILTPITGQLSFIDI